MGNMSSKAIYEIKARRGVGSRRLRSRGIGTISEEAVPAGRSVDGSYRQLSVDDQRGFIDDHVNHVQDSSETSAMSCTNALLADPVPTVQDDANAADSVPAVQDDNNLADPVPAVQDDNNAADPVPAVMGTGAITDATNGDGEVIDKIEELEDAVQAARGTPGDGTVTPKAKKEELVCVTGKSYTLPKKLSPDTIGMFERRERNCKSFSPYRTPLSEKMKGRISIFEPTAVTAKKRSFSDVGVVVPQTSEKRWISKFDYHTGEVVFPESSVKKLISKFEYKTERPMKAPNKLGHQFVKAFSDAKAEIKNTRIDTFELNGDYVSLNMFIKIIIEAKNAIFDNKIKNNERMKEELGKWRELIDANKRNSCFDQLKLDIGNLCCEELENSVCKDEEWEQKLSLLRDIAIVINRIEYLDNLIR